MAQNPAEIGAEHDGSRVAQGGEIGRRHRGEVSEGPHTAADTGGVQHGTVVGREWIDSATHVAAQAVVSRTRRHDRSR